MSVRLDPTNQMVFDHAIDFCTGKMRLDARYNRARQPASLTVDAALAATDEQRAAADQSPIAQAIPGYNRLP